MSSDNMVVIAAALARRAGKPSRAKVLKIGLAGAVLGAWR